MKKSAALLLFALVFLLRLPAAQTLATGISTSPPTPAPPKSAAPAVKPSGEAHPPTTAAEMQSLISQLTQSNREITQANHDLLDLLKKQQGVLDDIQYDRRLQSRQIQTLEEHLEETLQENAQLQTKVATLEAAASVAEHGNPPAPAPAPAANPAPSPTAPAPVAAAPPPSTYLPPPESEGAPGTLSWHRLFTLSGNDSKTSNLFHVEGRQWRVLWHNLDKPGKAFQNTSGLFINAFPRDDTIPQKVCSKVGTGGDSTELVGPGNYYLKIEASGGAWELAVEDFR